MSRLSNAIGAFWYAWYHYEHDMAAKWAKAAEAKDNEAMGELKALNASDLHFVSSFLNNLPDKMDRDDVSRFMNIVETSPMPLQYYLMNKALAKAPMFATKKRVFEWSKKNGARAAKNPEAQPSE